MDGEHGQFPPAIDVLDRVEPVGRFVIEELSLVLAPPVAAGRLEDRGPEPVRSLEPDQRDHATHRHAADRDPSGIEPMATEGGDHVVDLVGRLLDVVEEGLRPHPVLGSPLAMAGEVDGAAADAGAGESQVPPGIQFLVGRPTVHPEQARGRRRGGFGPDEEAGDVGTESDVLRDRPQAAGKTFIEIRHAPTIASTGRSGDTATMLKILGGEFRSRILESPPNADTTRPITARVKESVFNLLRGWFDDATVLDLFAGVGTIGLEAVSRGATDVVMVEQDRRISSILRFNVEELGCGDRATVVQADAFGPAALAQAPRECDIVFLDPPYPLWRDEATRGRVLDLAKRCRAVMKAKSFLVLRLPEPFEGTLEGFEGPETHDYAEDMFVHLFMPGDGASDE